MFNISIKQTGQMKNIANAVPDLELVGYSDLPFNFLHRNSLLYVSSPAA